MKNMYLCLIVIIGISTVSCFSSNDEEIFMVVDNHTSTMQMGMGITKAESLVQTGRFQSEEGKPLTFSRTLNRRANCIVIDQPCGLLDWCCDGLSCDGYFEGKCNPADCKTNGEICSPSTKCCPPYICLPETGPAFHGFCGS